MSQDLCPKCGKQIYWLTGLPAHPSNQYCSDEEGCGWEAWNNTTLAERKSIEEQEKFVKDQVTLLPLINLLSLNEIFKPGTFIEVIKPITVDENFIKIIPAGSIGLINKNSNNSICISFKIHEEPVSTLMVDMKVKDMLEKTKLKVFSTEGQFTGVPMQW